MRSGELVVRGETLDTNHLIRFAAREAGKSARVVVLGMGIDEQLGGYSRHRTAFAKGGPEALAAEIRMEVERISERNLGRDDRIVSDHGISARYPFLDEDFVNFLSSPLRLPQL